MLVDTVAIAYRIRVRRWYVRRFASVQRERAYRASEEPAHEAELRAARR
jgi:hypothetical protein